MGHPGWTQTPGTLLGREGCSVLGVHSLCQDSCATSGHLGDLQARSATNGLMSLMRDCPWPCHHHHSHSRMVAKHEGSILRDGEGPSPGGAVSAWLCFTEQGFNFSKQCQLERDCSMAGSQWRARAAGRTPSGEGPLGQGRGQLWLLQLLWLL